jgi:hypothetical protein
VAAVERLGGMGAGEGGRAGGECLGCGLDGTVLLSFSVGLVCTAPEHGYSRNSFAGGVVGSRVFEPTIRISRESNPRYR